MTGLIIALIVVVLVVIGGALVAVRRRAANADVLPPPELGAPVDYTSLPVEEPQTFGERVRAAPLALKLLAVLLLIGLIALIGVGYYAFVQPSNTAVTPVGPPPTITDTAATVTNERTISVRATTANLSNGTDVSVALLENGNAFDWATAETTTGKVQDNAVTVSLSKRDDAPTPQQDRTYTVALTASGTNGRPAASDPVTLTVPGPYRAAFFSGGQQPAAPTQAATPTIEPATAVPATVEPTAVVTPTVEATAVPTQTATVFNGGRIRSAPSLAANNQVGTINAGETVQLLTKSANGLWYKIADQRGTTGWVYNNLLTVPAAVAAQVPVEGQQPSSTATSGTATSGTAAPTSGTATVSGLTARVFNGGRIRNAPNTGNSTQVGTVNAGETVQLLAKTADSQWYRITDQRGISGWVSRSLLTVSAAVAAQVPVGQ